MYPYGFFLSLQKNNLVYLELMDCQVSDKGNYGVVMEAILDSCHSLQKLPGQRYIQPGKIVIWNNR